MMDPQDVGRPDGPRQTCSVSWDLDPDKLIRPRSADSIKACGQHAAPTGRTNDRKRLLLLITPKVLAERGPSTHEALPKTRAGGPETRRNFVVPLRVCAILRVIANAHFMATYCVIWASVSRSPTGRVPQPKREILLQTRCRCSGRGFGTSTSRCGRWIPWPGVLGSA